MKRKGFMPTQHSRVCSAHFQSDDYETLDGRGKTLKIKRLKKDAVPSILNDVEIFPHLSLFHSLVTSNGADNHYTTLIQLVSRKYLRLRIKNNLKDHAREKAFGKPCGNDLHRRRMLYHD